MPSTKLKLRGRVIAELVDEDGSKRYFDAPNAIRDNFRQAVAAMIANQSTGVPTYIELWKGAESHYYEPDGAETDGELGASGQNKLSQEFTASSGYATVSGFYAVLLWLKRVGSPTGSLTVTIETDSTGSPSGTPLTNATSAAVDASSIGTTYDWVPFLFPNTPIPASTTTYHLVLNSSGYTYASTTAEINWGVDSVSPATSKFEKYNGSAWSAYSPSADGIYRIITKNNMQWTAYDGSHAAIAANPIISKSVANVTTARLLATFSKSQANDYIGLASLASDNTVGQVTYAAANILFKKTNTQILNFYWLVEVE